MRAGCMGVSTVGIMRGMYTLELTLPQANMDHPKKGASKILRGADMRLCFSLGDGKVLHGK